MLIRLIEGKYTQYKFNKRFSCNQFINHDTTIRFVKSFLINEEQLSFLLSFLFLSLFWYRTLFFSLSSVHSFTCVLSFTLPCYLLFSFPPPSLLICSSPTIINPVTSPINSWHIGYKCRDSLFWLLEERLLTVKGWTIQNCWTLCLEIVQTPKLKSHFSYRLKNPFHTSQYWLQVYIHHEDFICPDLLQKSLKLPRYL